VQQTDDDGEVLVDGRIETYPLHEVDLHVY
jgi:hypothetical protein